MSGDRSSDYLVVGAGAAGLAFADVLAYFERVLERLCATGRVDFHGETTWTGGGAFVTADGREHSLAHDCRVVDATYRAATIPANTPPPFPVAAGAQVVPVNDLVRIGAQAPEYVIVGAGKTATDACVWLLQQGVAPDAISWVIPRDPWMLNRAHVQPDPATIFGMAASTWEAAAASTSPEEMFLRLEDAGIMLRIDTAVSPTMAKTPTLATWELELLRSIPRVIRSGHLTGVSPGRLEFGATHLSTHPEALVVHCAASGHAYPPLVPIWADIIRLQTIRAGFPCFNAALAGYVEATRDDDAEKNRLCPPTPLPDTLQTWARMQVLGARATAAFMAEPDIAAWTQTTVLNPSRVPPDQQDSPEVTGSIDRIKRHAPDALTKLAAYAGIPG